ncbi:unnamed protein product [Pleuronectes platessa]|uniref:Uncharacterized protein n=1 Tax=Pleuronectes platessa TaxID=8262 RepID=A0A9N7YQS6_PLEPL|nr:unnamed protein product [Pleuronectes platessa]
MSAWPSASYRPAEVGPSQIPDLSPKRSFHTRPPENVADRVEEPWESNLNNSLRCGDAIGSSDRCLCGPSDCMHCGDKGVNHGREIPRAERQPGVNRLPENDKWCQGDAGDLQDKSGILTDQALINHLLTFCVYTVTSGGESDKDYCEQERLTLRPAAGIKADRPEVCGNYYHTSVTPDDTTLNFRPCEKLLLGAETLAENKTEGELP